jgi:hypothetical protein
VVTYSDTELGVYPSWLPVTTECPQQLTVTGRLTATAPVYARQYTNAAPTTFVNGTWAAHQICGCRPRQRKLKPQREPETIIGLVDAWGWTMIPDAARNRAT